MSGRSVDELSLADLHSMDLPTLRLAYRQLHTQVVQGRVKVRELQYQLSGRAQHHATEANNRARWLERRVVSLEGRLIRARKRASELRDGMTTRELLDLIETACQRIRAKQRRK